MKTCFWLMVWLALLASLSGCAGQASLPAHDWAAVSTPAHTLPAGSATGLPASPTAGDSSAPANAVPAAPSAVLPPAAAPSSRIAPPASLSQSRPGSPPVVPPVSVPAPRAATPPPAPITGCDAGGCTDAGGNRYGGGTGNVYLDRQGRTCLRSGNWLQCQ